MTVPGTPFIYYGDEIGLTDLQKGTETGLPHMIWNSSRDTTISHHPGKEVTWGQQSSVEEQMRNKKSLLKLYQVLTHIKSQEPSLLQGNFSLVSNTSDAFSYIRTSSCSRLLIVLNFGSGRWEEDYRQRGLSARAVIVTSSNLDRQGEVQLEHLHLGPREALVLKLFQNDAS
nr:PREDICTED: 4F2 cell-surface antigen heavy chain-like [Latimeria chalumnae]|eukprot:XP_014351269.1 PREDICTED: 4F2 cell-surface antigen heavy chain-like [Latimeria chalumnae]